MAAQLPQQTSFEGLLCTRVWGALSSFSRVANRQTEKRPLWDECWQREASVARLEGGQGGEVSRDTPRPHAQAWGRRASRKAQG